MSARMECINPVGTEGQTGNKMNVIMICRGRPVRLPGHKNKYPLIKRINIP